MNDHAILSTVLLLSKFPAYISPNPPAFLYEDQLILIQQPDMYLIVFSCNGYTVGARRASVTATGGPAYALGAPRV